jgi:LuxR family maltose regulon positive regulatory protein
VAWLTCEEDDADLTRLISSIAQAAEIAGMMVDNSAASDTDRVAGLWKIQYDACLIIDDFEKAATPETERFVERLYDRLNPQFLILIATRQPLRSWFLRREVAGEALSVGASALRFSEEEIRSLVPAVAGDELAEIEASTEGWPFAIQLIALRRRRGEGGGGLLAASGDSAGLFDYLSDQIMASLNVEQQRFLRDMAVLGQVDADTADAILGRSDSAAIIRSLQHLDPIMVGSADDPPFLQLHPLFRQFLLSSAGGVGGSRMRLLHRGAAQHYEREGDFAAAVRQAVAANDAELTEAIFARSGNELAIIDIGVSRMTSVLARVPDELKRDAPGLEMISFVTAAATANASDTLHWERRLRAAGLPVASVEWPEGQWIDYADTLLLLGTSFCTAVDVAAVLERAEQCADRARDFLAMEPRARVILLSFKTLLALRQGWIEGAKSSLAEYQSICEAIGVAANQPSINPQRGLIAFAEGDLDGARLYFERSADLRLDEFGAPEPLLAQYCRIMLARIFYERGQLPEAAALLENTRLDPEKALPDMVIQYWQVRTLASLHTGEGEAVVRALIEQIEDSNESFARCRPSLQALLVEASRLVGSDPDLALVELLSDRLDQVLDQPRPSLLEVERLARAVIPAEISLGRNGRAKTLADRALAAIVPTGQPLALSEMHLLRAEAIAASGGSPKEDLVAALATAQATQVFADLVRRATPALLTALAGSENRLASACVRATFQSGRTSAPALASLTDRERDIAVEAMVRNSTKEIARALDLSPETVKHHLRNIFAKLGVHSREEAVRHLAGGPPEGHPPP